MIISIGVRNANPYIFAFVAVEQRLELNLQQLRPKSASKIKARLGECPWIKKVQENMNDEDTPPTYHLDRGFLGLLPDLSLNSRHHHHDLRVVMINLVS
ncbi:hypothetical protein Ancab_039015 [Ancistrocladus abbreviatus]